jgi:hypothetical protein
LSLLLRIRSRLLSPIYISASPSSAFLVEV